MGRYDMPLVKANRPALVGRAISESLYMNSARRLYIYIYIYIYIKLDCAPSAGQRRSQGFITSYIDDETD
jgi:hypothetical protein